MNIFERLRFYALNIPEAVAYQYRDIQLTYGELADQSDALAVWLFKNAPDKIPVAVYGHKQRDMLICFFACVKAGHAYIPLDSSLPPERIRDIMEGSEARLVLCADALGTDFGAGVKNVSLEQIHKITDEYTGKKPDPSYAVKDNETYYIIYTSGSTGKPKGVQISLRNLESFIRWGLAFTGTGLSGGETFMNQAPFSFDLSVMDLYLSLAGGNTLFAVDKTMTANMGELFEQFRQSGISVWVSTPSFADMCLADPAFDSGLLPHLKTFLFCGETLSNHTVQELHRRFEGSRVYNLYGPTEATVAVTQVLITDKIVNTVHPLPVGKVKSDCRIHIMADGKCLPEGESGEIVITGDSVSGGY